MKRLFLTAIALMFLATLPAYTQETPATEKKQETQDEKQKSPGAKVDKNNFVDENGDGINDNISTGKQIRGNNRRARQHDRFIDADGDGINDSRCSGLGVGKNKHCVKRRGGEK